MNIEFTPSWAKRRVHQRLVFIALCNIDPPSTSVTRVKARWISPLSCFSVVARTTTKHAIHENTLGHLCWHCFWHLHDGPRQSRPKDYGGHAETYTTPNGYVIDYGATFFADMKVVKDNFTRLNVPLINNLLRWEKRTISTFLLPNWSTLLNRMLLFKPLRSWFMANRLPSILLFSSTST